MPLSAEIMGLLARRRSVDWWLSGGVDPAIVVAVYRPKGAASLATSYINLANPGTYNAAPGTAPTFNAATGWTFNGTTQYLLTGITSYASSWSLIVKYSGATADNGLPRRILFGASPSNGNRFGLQPWRVSGGIGGVLYMQGSFTAVTPHLAAGTLGIAGGTGYRNGVANGTIVDESGTYHPQLMIGAASNDAGAASSFCPVTISSICVYSGTLTADQVAAVHAAMP